jgi:hypothetical protein
MRKMTAILLAMTFAGPAFSQGDAKAVIQKAIDAHGGKEKIDKYPAAISKFKGEMSVSGLDMTFEGKGAQGPNQYKIELVADVAGQKLTISQAVDGGKVKVKAMLAGMMLPQPEDEAAMEELKFALVNQEISQLTPLIANVKKYSIKSGPDEDVDGKKAATVDVTVKMDGDKTKEVKLFFDKDSSLLVKYSRKGLSPGAGDGKEALQESVMSDFKVIEGVKVPMKVVNYSDGKKFMSMTQVEYKLLEKLDPKDVKIDD